MRCATATRAAVVLLLSQMLHGCMMAGMGGMAHAGARDMPNAHDLSRARNPTIVKEVLDREIRMTAEFPDYLASDSLIYTVTLRSLDGRSIKPDAKIFLSASATPRVGAASTTSMSRAGHDGMVNRDTRDTLFRIMVAPVARDGGTFTFAPSIPRDGPYRIRVLVERIGNTVLDPPLTVEQIVSLDAREMSPSEAGVSNHRVRWQTVAFVSAGVLLMGTMMLFSFR